VIVDEFGERVGNRKEFVAAVNISDKLMRDAIGTGNSSSELPSNRGNSIDISAETDCPSKYSLKRLRRDRLCTMQRKWNTIYDVSGCTETACDFRGWQVQQEQFLNAITNGRVRQAFDGGVQECPVL